MEKLSSQAMYARAKLCCTKRHGQENTSSSKETSAFKTSRQMNSLTSCIHCLADKLLQDGDNVFLIFLLLEISYALEEFGSSNLFKSHCTSPCDHCTSFALAKRNKSATFWVNFSFQFCLPRCKDCRYITLWCKHYIKSKRKCKYIFLLAAVDTGQTDQDELQSRMVSGLLWSVHLTNVGTRHTRWTASS